MSLELICLISDLVIYRKISLGEGGNLSNEKLQELNQETIPNDCLLPSCTWFWAMLYPSAAVTDAITPPK